MNSRVEELYKQIADAQEELKPIREKCTHVETFMGNWSERPGSIIVADICQECGGFVKWRSDLVPFPVNTIE